MENSCNDQLPEIFYTHGQAKHYCALELHSSLAVGQDCDRYHFEGNFSEFYGEDGDWEGTDVAKMQTSIACAKAGPERPASHCWEFDRDGQFCSSIPTCDIVPIIGYELLTEVAYKGSTTQSN